MDYTSENAQIVLDLIAKSQRHDEPANAKLKRLWLTLLRTRLHTLAQGVRELTGPRIHGGPFKGMALTPEMMEAFQTSVMIGCYEHELHPIIEKIVASGFTRIVNIGCSSGYYAVGLARRMPQACIDAFDISPTAQAQCRALAAANNVGDRVTIGGQFYGDDFASYAGHKTLVIADIEGGEVSLLQPERYPALRECALLVELHDVMDPTISDTLGKRFAATHNVEMIANRNFMPDLSGLLPVGTYMDPFDQLLLGWEGREGPTPWGFFTKK